MGKRGFTGLAVLGVIAYAIVGGDKSERSTPSTPPPSATTPLYEVPTYSPVPRRFATPPVTTTGLPDTGTVRPGPSVAPSESRKDQRPPERPAALADAAIVALLIKSSIASYPGNCACPYNSDRAGRSCGRRSAHSKAGGRGPLCFSDDVTPAMVAAYRQRQAMR